MKAMQIDLNADLGEYDDPQAIQRDIALMQYISSCNIACGGHAGSPELMRTMLGAASHAGIAAGAHPSYPDRTGFGRSTVDIGTKQLCSSIVEQVQSLADIARQMAFPLTHIKPHGALYNDLAEDSELAGKVAQTLYQAFPHLKIVGLAHSVLEGAVRRAGAIFVREAFIDRRYTSAGKLLARARDGAVLTNDAARIEQAMSLALHHKAAADTSAAISIAAESLCIHSDSPGALESAKTVRAALEREGVKVTAP